MLHLQPKKKSNHDYNYIFSYISISNIQFYIINRKTINETIIQFSRKESTTFLIVTYKLKCNLLIMWFLKDNLVINNTVQQESVFLISLITYEKLDLKDEAGHSNVLKKNKSFSYVTDQHLHHR